MIAGPALLSLLAAAPTLVAVRVETVEARPALVVEASADLGRVDVRRAGPEVVVRVGAEPTARLAPVAVTPPIQAVTVEKATPGASIRVRVAPGVPYEIRRERRVLIVLFGHPRPEAAPTPAPEVRELYEQLKPPLLTVPADPQAPPEGEGGTDDVAEGLQVGLLTLRPSVTGTYYDAEGAFLDTPDPVRDQYYEVRPQVEGDLPIGLGQLRASYQLRLRRGSRFDVVDTPSHFADASLLLPVGSRLTLEGAHHFARGALEATEVDPGREFFFRLGRFTRHQTTAGLRLPLGWRFGLQLGAARNDVEIDDGAGFFDYEARSATAGLTIELTPNVRSVLAWTYDEVPAPAERPEAESRAHSGSVSLTGELFPLVTGELSAGYRDQRSPGASEESGRRYRGLTLSGRLTKEFTRATRLSLAGGRATSLSAFEGNAFYVADFVESQVTLTLPLSVAFHGGFGYHRNDYRTLAGEIGRPREDRITAWSVGLARPVASWAWLRADYRRERRDSNIDRLDAEFEAVTVQAGIRLYRSSQSP